MRHVLGEQPERCVDAFVLDTLQWEREIAGMSVHRELLDILVCPESRAALIYFGAGTVEDRDFLFCPQSRLKYRVDDGIPVMLVDEADRLDESKAASLVSKAKELGLLS